MNMKNLYFIFMGILGLLQVSSLYAETRANIAHGFSPLSSLNHETVHRKSEKNASLFSNNEFWAVPMPLDISVSITSNSPVCEGNTLSLTASEITNATYLWSGPDGFTSADRILNRNNATSAMSGVYTVTATEGLNSDSEEITVLIIEDFSGVSASSNTPLCKNGTLILTAGLYNGASYSWTGPNGFTANGNYVTLYNIQNTGAGEYSLTVSGGSCTPVNSTTSVSVLLTSTGSASSNSPVCTTSPVYFNSSSISGASYSWAGPEGFTSTAHSPSIPNPQHSMSGDYTLTVIAPGCGTTVSITNLQVGNSLNSVFAGSNSPVCSGNTLNVTATSLAGVSYNWTGPNSFTSNQSSFSIESTTLLNSGSYQLTAQSPGCGTVTRSPNVSIINSAILNAGSNSPLCTGGNLTLSVNSVSNATYSWTGPNSYTGSGQFPQIVYNVGSSQSGEYTLTVSQPGCGTQTAYVSVIVSSNPSTASTQSNSPICSVGGTLNLSASSISGASYSWTGPGGFTADTQNASRTNMQLSDAGNYTCVISTPGCASVTRNRAVVVHNLIPGSNSPVCQGGSLYLSVNNISGATYNWAGPNGFTSALQNPGLNNMQPSQSGEYTLTMSHPGCAPAVSTTQVLIGTQVTQASVTSNSPVCTGNTLQLTAVNHTGYSFSWIGPDGFTSAEAQPLIPGVSFANEGVYTLAVSSPGCGSTTRTLNVSITTSLIVADWTVGVGGDFSSLQSAIADANVVNGNVIRILPGTYNVTSAITINKQLKIFGDADAPSNVVFQTPNNGTAPVNMFVVSADHVQLTGLTIRHRKTTNTSVETAIVASGGGSPQTRVDGLVISNCRIEHVEFGIIVRGSNWHLLNNEVAYVEIGQPANSTRRHIGLYGVDGSCAIDGILFEDNTISGNTRAIAPTNTTGTNPNETYTGNLVVKNCTQSGRLQQFYNQDAFQGDPGDYHLWFLNNTVNEYSLFIGFFGTSSNYGDILGEINISGNTFSNAHATSPIGGKGMIAADGSGAFRSTNLIVHHDNNTPGQTNYRADYSSVATISDPWIVGRSNNITSYNATVDGNLTTAPLQAIPPRLFFVSTNAPVCEGNLLNIGASLIPGGTYSWTGPDGFTSVLRNNPFFNATTAMTGIYSLSLTTSCGITSTTASVIVGSSLSGISLASNTPICEGNALNLSATDRTGFTFQWTGPNGFTSSVAAPVISNAQGAHSGIYTVVFQSPGCGSVTQTHAANVSVIPIMNLSNNGPLCQGNILYLNANSVSGATYSWAGPNGYTSNIQSPSIMNAQPGHTGEYTLTVNTLACGSVESSTNVVVGGSLSLATATGNTPICAGDDLFLTATNPGYTYSWTGPNGFTSTVAEPVISSVNSSHTGAYQVGFTSPGCGTVTRTLNVSVVTQTGLTIGSNSPVCQGSNIQLTSSAVSGATYSWEGPNGYTSSLQNPIIVGSQTINNGIYTLTVNTSSCGTSSETTTVQVGSSLGLVSMTGNVPVCEGNDLNLTAANHSGFTFNWNGPNSFTSTAAQPVINSASALNAGVYTLVVNSPGCGSTTRTLSVAVNSSPSVSASNNGALCQGSTLYLNATTVSGATYSWTGPNAFTSNVKSPGISNAQPSHSGEYTVTVNTGACGNVSATTTVGVGASLNATSLTANTPVCSGSDLLLTASNPGYTYSWTGPDGFTSTNAEPVIESVSNTHAGVYQVQISSVGCGTVTRTLSVAVVDQGSLAAGNNTPLCQGGIVYLTTGTLTGVTYSWEGPDGFTSAVQNPAIGNAQAGNSGIYTLTTSSISCGTASTTTVVEVGSSLSSINLTGNTPLCVGADLQLTVTDRQGYTFNWTGPNGFTSSIAQPVVNNVSALDAGTYSVNISSPGCGTTGRSLNVTVNDAQSVTPGSNSPRCQGSPLYFSANNVSGASYSWTGPNGFTSAVRSPSISSPMPSATGVYTLVVTTSSCGSVSSTTSVVVGAALSPISALSNSPICVGNDLNLSATQNIGYSFSWTGPNGFTSTDAEPVIENVTTSNHGQYTVVITSAGCGSATRNANVIVNNPASVTASNSGPVCANYVLYFNSTAPTGTTYLWNGPSGYTSAQAKPSIGPILLSQAGIYTLNATVPGCGVVSVTTTVTVNSCKESQTPPPIAEGSTASDNEFTENQNLVFVESGNQFQTVSLTIIPNPSSGNALQLKWEGLKGLDKTITVRIFDVNGKVVWIKSIHRDHSESDVLEDDLNFPVQLSKGIYTIESEQSGKFIYARMIVQ